MIKTAMIGLLVLVLWQSSPAETPEDYQQNWPQWRGPLATGVAPQSNPPVEWSETKNIRWKVAVPGYGHATPVIWGDLIFVQSAVDAEAAGDGETTAEEQRRRKTAGRLQYTVFALERPDGKIRWKKVVVEDTPHEGTHQDGSWASNSPVTDGQHLYAYFGSRGLFCLDFQGKEIWRTDLGDMQTRRGFGEGSSPALYGDVLVINWDHEGESFIAALDKHTGKNRWRAARDEPTSWSTPLIVERNGQPQVIVNATNRTRSYDLHSGAVLWETEGMTLNTIPSPLPHGDHVIVMSGFRGSMAQSIRLDAADETERIAWSYDRDTPYVPSPLLYHNYLYFLKVNKGVLTCMNVTTGEVYYNNQRLEGIPNIYASPVGAAGRVYITGREGTTVVLQNGPEYQVLATNPLEDRFNASAAIVGDEIYLRGEKYLYCLARD